MSTRSYGQAFRVALAGLLASSAVLGPRTAAADQLLVLEKGTQTLAIVDPKTLEVRARVPAGADPHEVIASSDGRVAYISNYGGEGSSQHTLSRADLVTRQALPPLDLGALRSAHGLDFAGGEVYFTAETSKVIGRYDPASARIDWVMGTGEDRTHMILVAGPDRIYTSNVRSGTIAILQSSVLQTPFQRGVTVWHVTRVPAGRGSEGFDVSPDGSQLWAANGQDATVTVIDLKTQQPVATFPIPVTFPNRLKFTHDGRHVLVSALGRFGQPHAPGSNDLIVLDASSHQLVKTFDLGGGAAGVLIAPDGRHAYVAVSQADRVAELDVQSLSVSRTITGVSKPDGMAWAAAGR